MSTNSINTNQRILIVDDTLKNIQVLGTILKNKGYEIDVAQCGQEALEAVHSSPPDLILLDVEMPELNGFETCLQIKEIPGSSDIPIIFVTIKEDMGNLKRGFQVGGVDYVAKPFETDELLARVRTHLEIYRLKAELKVKNKNLEKQARELKEVNELRLEEVNRSKILEEELTNADEKLSLITLRESARWGIKGFVGKSKTIEKILNNVRQLQSTDRTSVLITGESGTGKELVARAIHFGGSRSKGPFIPVNCATIPRQLAESLLFGHEAGAFTGAKTKKGYFELASAGTLFLDEIGEMPIELQPTLLRVIETGSLITVGGDKEKKVDVRILAATNKDLKLGIAEGTFRHDLYYRLARFPISVPSLRDRKEDIPLLTNHFLHLFEDEMGIPKSAMPILSSRTLNALMKYDFPGNIRELKNIIECALIRAESSIISPEHLNFIDFPPSSSNSQSRLRMNQSLAVPIVSHKELESLVIERAQSKIKKGDHQLNDKTDEEKILTYLRLNGNINNTQCRELLNVNNSRAAYLLNKMVGYGLLNRTGERRWSRYRLTAE